MLELGCAQLARWQVAAPDLVLSISLSPLQFRDPELCPQIFDCIAPRARPGTGAGDHRRGADGDADEIESNLASLAEAGFQLAIDDFGRWRPSSSTKLHPGLATNQATTAIVRSVIGLGHELGIKITAEGWRRRSSRPGWCRSVAIGCKAICSAAPPTGRVCPGYQLPGNKPATTRHPEGGLVVLQKRA